MSDQTKNSKGLTQSQQTLLALRELRAKVDTLEYSRSEPIAIIGIGCRFPGGVEGPEAFWQSLQNGVDAISEIPANRWERAKFYDPNPDTPGKTYTLHGGFVDGIDLFDPRFFGITPREAVSMDPQQRLLLEVTWQALEHAGIVPEALTGSLTGVFVGISSADYSWTLQKSIGADQLDMYTSTGNTNSIAAGRLSYSLALQGPCMAIDTACSSSLVAVHTACQSLRTGDSDMAIAGGVNVILSPHPTIGLCKARALSPGGRCKTFDASADGYVRSEGCGMIVLKRLSDALANDDNILALIRGSAINQDGRSNGLTAPNGLAQEAVLRRALRNAQVQANQVEYLEAHGTGTPLGDPVEMRSVARVYGEQRTKDEVLHIGSVKTNLGHLEAAAGIAGLIKVVLGLQRDAIPPHLHFESVNPHIKLDEIPASIPVKLTPWQRASKPRSAAVSSFGFSGTNSHVILEEAPYQGSRDDDIGNGETVERPLHLLALSTQGEAATRDLASCYLAMLQEGKVTSVADLAFSANTTRSQFEHRLAVPCSSPDDLQTKLEAFVSGDPHSALTTKTESSSETPKVAFLCTGQGAQYGEMASVLYRTQPTFRRIMDQCNDLLGSTLEKPLLSVLFGAEKDGSLINQTAFTQPALFAIGYGLAELWKSWGIEPAAVAGHSVGEYVAAAIAGVFTMEEGLKLIAERGRLMQSLPQNGAMAAVFTSQKNVESAIQAHLDAVSIAAVNAPDNIVISGERKTVEAVTQELGTAGVKSQMLTVSHAFHSPLMEPILNDFEKSAKKFTFQQAQIPLIANVTGDFVTDERRLDAGYWRQHIRQPVQFAGCVKEMRGLNCNAFVEIGPNPTLISMARRSLDDPKALWLPSLRRGQDDWSVLLRSLGELYVAGAEVNWPGFDADYRRRRVTLPTYPFQRKRYWIDSEITMGEDDLSEWFYETVWRESSHPAEDNFSKSTGLSDSSWLIFSDRGGAGTTLAKKLRACEAAVVEVQQGKKFSSEGDESVALNPTDSSHFDKLLADSDKKINGIIYLWPLDSSSDNDGDEVDLTAKVVGSAGPFLHLIQALVRCGITELTRLCVVTQGAQPFETDASAIIFAHAGLWGMCRTLTVEQAGFHCINIDLPTACLPEDAAKYLWTELTNADSENQIIRRGEKRHVARLTRMADTLGSSQLEPNMAEGSYLVTGGTGALGSMVAARLVETGASQLVLLSRSKPKGKALEAIENLKKKGAEVLVLRADVSNYSELAAAFEKIESKLPPLRGIVHAAGISEDATLINQDWTTLANVAAAKAAGAWNLHRLTATQDLDFFVLFSSMAATFGSYGQGNYAAANACMDTIALWRRTLGLAATTVNWGPWSGGGMAAALGQEQIRQWETTGLTLIAPELGMRLFDRILTSKQTQLGAFRMDWQRFIEAASLSTVPAFLSEVLSSKDMKQRAGKPSQEWTRLMTEISKILAVDRPRLLSTFVVEQVREIIGLSGDETIEKEKGFFELGMDSLMAVELRSRLESHIAQALPRSLTFEYPDVKSVAGFLLEHVIPSGAKVKKAAVEEKRQKPEIDSRDQPGDEADAELFKEFDEQLVSIRQDLERR